MFSVKIAENIKYLHDSCGHLMSEVIKMLKIFFSGISNKNIITVIFICFILISGTYILVALDVLVDSINNMLINFYMCCYQLHLFAPFLFETTCILWNNDFSVLAIFNNIIKSTQQQWHWIIKFRHKTTSVDMEIISFAKFPQVFGIFIENCCFSSILSLEEWYACLNLLLFSVFLSFCFLLCSSWLFK